MSLYLCIIFDPQEFSFLCSMKRNLRMRNSCEPLTKVILVDLMGSAHSVNSASWDIAKQRNGINWMKPRSITNVPPILHHETASLGCAPIGCGIAERSWLVVTSFYWFRHFLLRKFIDRNTDSCITHRAWGNQSIEILLFMEWEERKDSD